MINVNYLKQKIHRLNTLKIKSLLVFCLVIFIVFMHVLVLKYSGPLWRDEANTAQLASEPLSQGIYKTLHYDSFPITTTVFFHAINDFTTTDFKFRIIGFLVGLCILGTLFINGRLLGFGLPLFSIFFLGLNVTFIKYGDSIRPYGLGTFFILVVIGLIWHILSCKNSFNYKNIIISLIFSVLAVQTLYQNSFLLLVICVSGLTICTINKEWKKFLSILFIGAFSLISILPYLYYFPFINSWRIINNGITCKYLFDSFVSTIGPIGCILFSLQFILIFLGIFYWIVFYKKNIINKDARDIFLYTSIISFLSIIIYIVFLKTTKPFIQPWYFIPLIALLSISLDSFFTKILDDFNLKFLWILIFILIPIILISSSSTLADNLTIRASNIDIVSYYLQKNTQKNDLILVSPWYLGVSFNREYNGKNNWVTIPKIDDPSIHRYDLFNKREKDTDSLKDISSIIENTLNEGNNVWFVEDLSPASLKEKKSGIEIFNFLVYHSVKIDKFDTERGETINPYERINLVRFTGWKL